MQKEQYHNSILVSNLPNTTSRDLDLTILVYKTHILPFLSDYWFDTDTNVGHLLLKKPRFMEFVLFVLNNYLKHDDDMNCIFEKELLDTSTHRFTNSSRNDSGQFDNFIRRRVQTSNANNVSIVIILS